MGRTARRIGLFALGALFCALLAACNTITGVADKGDTQDADVLEKVRSVDLLPRFPTQSAGAELATGRRAKPAIYPAEPADADGADLRLGAASLGTANGEGL